MKANIILTSIIIMLFALIAQAQNAYIPSVVPGNKSNHTWYAAGDPGTGPTPIPCYTKVTCDTIQVNGKTYNFVDANGQEDSYGCPSANYIREDTLEQKIHYTTSNPEDEEKILIDFSLEQGDTIFNYWSETSVQVIDTIEYIEIAGEVRKVLIIVPLYDYFIEGIGHSMNGLGLPNFGLKSSDGLVIEDCWSVANHNIISEEEHFSINPNPSNGEIIIERLNNNLNTENIVEIRSINGQLLNRLIFTGESQIMDTSTFPKGILMVTLISDHLVETKKIINK